MAFDITVTVASGTVDSDLTDFPLYIDLSTLPAAFWDGMATDGAKVRVYAANGTTQLPFDIAYINTTSDTGQLYVKTNLATASATEIHIKDDGVGTLATDDTYGSEAVWSDYEVAIVGNDQKDHTDDTSLSTSGTPTDSGVDGLLFNANGEKVYGSTTTTNNQWTLSATVKVNNDTQNHYVAAYDDNISTARHVIYVNASDNFAEYNNTDGNNTSTISPTVGVWTHVANLQNGTTNRKLYVDGVIGQTDTTVTSCWPAAGSKDVIAGADSGSSGGNFYNRYTVLRTGVVAEDWVEAEAANHTSPGTFYVVGGEDFEYLIDFSRGGRLPNIADIAHAVGGAHSLTYPTYASYKNGFARILDSAAEELRGSGLKRVDNTTGDYGYSHIGIEYQEAAHPTGGTLVWPKGVMIEPASYLRTDKALYLDTATTLFNATLVADEDCGDLEGWLLTADTSDNPHYFSGHTASTSSEVIFTAILKDDGSGTRVMFRGAGNGSDSTEWPRMVIDMGTGDILESDYDLTSPGLYSTGGKRDLGDGWTEYWMQLHRSVAESNYAQVFLAPSDWELVDGAFPDYVGSTAEKVLIASVQTKTHINNAMQLTAPIGDDEAQPIYGGDELTITPSFAPVNTEGAILLRLASYSLKWDNTNPEATATYYAHDVINNGTTTVLSITDDGYLKLEDGTNTVTGTTDIHDGAEHDVIMSWSNADSTMKIYLDGLEEATGSYDGTFPSLSTIDIGHAGFNGVLCKFGVSASKYVPSITPVTISATTSLTASLDKAKIVYESISGALTLTGSVANTTNDEAISGTLTVTAGFSKIFIAARSISGALTVTPSIAKAVQKVLSGTVSVVSSLAQDYTAMILSAAVTAGGAITKNLNRAINAVLALVGEPNEQKFGQIWTPYRSLNVLAHFDASDSGSITVNPTFVSEVKDQTPNNLDLVPEGFTTSSFSVTANRLFVSSMFYPLRAELHSKLPSGTAGVTIVLISDLAGTGAGDGVTNAGGIHIGYGDLGTYGKYVGISNTQFPNKWAIDTGGGVSGFHDSTLDADGTNQMVMISVEDGSQDIWVNGVAGTGATDTMDIDYSGDTGLYLGAAAYSGGDPKRESNAYYMRAMVIEGTLTTDERERLEAWLANDFGDLNLLPEGHSYDSGRSFEPITLSDVVGMTGDVSLLTIISQTTIAAVASLTATLDKLTSEVQSIVASLTTTADISKRLDRVMSATSSVVASVVRSINRSMDATVTLTGSIAQNIRQTIAAALTTTASFAKVLDRSMSAIVSLTPDVVKDVIKSLAGALSVQGTVVKSFSMILSSAVSASASVIKLCWRTVDAAVTATASLSKLAAQLVTIAATQTVVGVVQKVKTVFEAISGGLTVGVSLGKQLNRTMTAEVTTVGALLRTFYRTLADSVTLTGQTGPAQFRVIAASVSLVATLITALPSTGGTFGKIVFKAAVRGIARLRK